MITLRRAKERQLDRRRRQETWRSFDPGNRASALAQGFASLYLLNETRLPPGAGLAPHPPHDAEIVTFVREGALAYQDSSGRSGITSSGEFQRMSARRGIRRTETNASRTDWAHVFQIWLCPPGAGLDPKYEQKRFSEAERRNALRVIGSPDGQRGSLHIHEDAFVYSAILDPGQHVVHEISVGRGAWLHIVQGETTLGDVILTTGDGAGVTAERAASFTAREKTEILLVDLTCGLANGQTPGSIP